MERRRDRKTKLHGAATAEGDAQYDILTRHPCMYSLHYSVQVNLSRSKDPYLCFFNPPRSSTFIVISPPLEIREHH